MIYKTWEAPFEYHVLWKGGSIYLSLPVTWGFTIEEPLDSLFDALCVVDCPTMPPIHRDDREKEMALRENATKGPTWR